jgi:hypothetical protein
MNHSQSSFNTDRFKDICSGRNCKRKPATRLRIKYVKRIGEFCELCAADLIEADLVERAFPIEK